MEYLTVLIAVVGAFYFILLRPVMVQQRRHRRDISSLGVGDEVLTTAGFYATVTEINTYEDRPMEILLLVAPDVILRGTPAAIDSIVRRAETPEPADDGEDVDTNLETAEDAADTASSIER